MTGHNDLCVGIDLGTTNSVLATINEKANGDAVSKVVEISRAIDMYNGVSGDAKLGKMKKPTLPSCIYYRQEKNYEPLVGDFAKEELIGKFAAEYAASTTVTYDIPEGATLTVKEVSSNQVSATVANNQFKVVVNEPISTETVKITVIEKPKIGPFFWMFLIFVILFIVVFIIRQTFFLPVNPDTIKNVVLDESKNKTNSLKKYFPKGAIENALIKFLKENSDGKIFGGN